MSGERLQLPRTRSENQSDRLHSEVRGWFERGGAGDTVSKRGPRKSRLTMARTAAAFLVSGTAYAARSAMSTRYAAWSSRSRRRALAAPTSSLSSTSISYG